MNSINTLYPIDLIGKDEKEIIELLTKYADSKFTIYKAFGWVLDVDCLEEFYTNNFLRVSRYVEDFNINFKYYSIDFEIKSLKATKIISKDKVEYDCFEGSILKKKDYDEIFLSRFENNDFVYEYIEKRDENSWIKKIANDLEEWDLYWDKDKDEEDFENVAKLYLEKNLDGKRVYTSFKKYKKDLVELMEYYLYSRHEIDISDEAEFYHNRELLFIDWDCDYVDIEDVSQKYTNRCITGYNYFDLLTDLRLEVIKRGNWFDELASLEDLGVDIRKFWFSEKFKKFYLDNSYALTLEELEEELQRFESFKGGNSVYWFDGDIIYWFSEFLEKEFCENFSEKCYDEQNIQYAEQIIHNVISKYHWDELDRLFFRNERYGWVNKAGEILKIIE